MRACPNCGGGLKFDIKSQGLKCPNCSSGFGVGEVPETREAKADGTMEAMIFTCPQCGGQVFSTSETAAGFCSFCGASVQLSGRMSKERMPDKIIPFKITKEECARKFREHVGSYFFSPGDLRKDNAKLEFRGIYMPYWDYVVHQQAQINRHYEDEHRSGDYRVIKHYDFNWDLNEDIPNIQHDASTSFDDEVGLAISPFDPKDSVPFDSGYIEGFYGDISDTKWEDYSDFALNEAVDYTERAIDQKTMGVRTDNGPVGNEEFNGHIAQKYLAMFPVWFMSYRSGSRVAYTAVNGQTGRVHVDLPVSISRFFGLTAALTALLFAVFMLFFTPTPQMDIVFASIMTIAASVLFISFTKQILDKDNEALENQTESKGKGNSLIGIARLFVPVILVAYFVISNISILGDVVALLFSGSLTAALAAVFAICAVVCFFKRNTALTESNGGGIFPSPLFSFISAVLALLVSWLNPVSDFIYYGITIAALAFGAISLISLLSIRNILCTRRMPEFDTHKGGDHRARS